MFYRVLLGIIIIILLEISFDHNTMFYRVLLGIRIIILLEISCDSSEIREIQGKIRKIRARFEDSKEIPGAVDVIPNRVEPLVLLCLQQERPCRLLGG